MAGGGLGGPTEPAPFVLTAEIDGQSFARFDSLRRRYFPPERNVVPAHITLFHRLPAERAREIKALLRMAADRQQTIETGPGEAKATGTGVAIFLSSPQLSAFREQLASEWWPWLGDQDRAGFRPHVTLQNKVSAVVARQTLLEVRQTRQLPVRILGAHLWRYRDRRWEDVALFRFR